MPLLPQSSSDPTVVADYQRVLAHNRLFDPIDTVHEELAPTAGEHLGSECSWTVTTKNGQQLHLFVKHVSKNLPDFFRDAGLFDKESAFVNDLLPDWKAKAETAAAMDVKLDFFPTYLRADSSRIVMTNMVKDGAYSQACKLAKLDLDYVKYVLEKLAQFHALSYDVNGPDANLVRYPFLKERLYAEGKEVLDIGHDNLLRAKIAVVKASVKDTDGPAKVDKAIKFLQSGLGTVYGELMKALDHNSPHFCYVVNHGDCWTTNLLFKTDPETKKVVHHVFLDFQLLRLGSPCLDLTYFLFSSAQPAMLENNWSHLTRFYFDRFKTAVKKLHGDHLFGHTFEEFLQDFKRKSPFGFWLSLVYFTGFDIIPHLDMSKVEMDVSGQDSDLKQQISDWIQANPTRTSDLASEIVTVVDIFSQIQEL